MNVLDRGAEARESLEDAGVLLQPLDDFSRRPAETGSRFQGRQAVRDFAEDGRGGVADHYLLLNPLEELRAGRAQGGVGGEVIHEDVGIDKEGVAAVQVREGHALSSGSSSGSRAKYRSSSLVPCQPNIPAVAWTQLAVGSIVTRTFSCSLRGNGWAGL